MEKKHIEVIEYDPRWPLFFEEEALRVQEILGKNCADIHHIGSTAVPGLWAKPVIDICVVVHAINDSIFHKMKDIHYIYKGEFNILLRFFFKKHGKFVVNLHLYKKGHGEIALNLLFRNFLRQNPSAREKFY